ncbi:MAG: hypothetical protein R2864_09840 [Syntrophotaleaceae bacterium]
MTNARVGQITDYDKLNLEVFTDGSVRPDDAVAWGPRFSRTSCRFSSALMKMPKRGVDETEEVGR